MGLATGTSFSAFGPSRAFALDMDVNDGLITETVASRDRLKYYDNIKKYGAERVSDRDRAEFEPIGIRAGNYLVFPSLGTTVVYDNNIFASNANKQADFRSELTPKIYFKSQLPRHVLDLSVGGKIVNHLDHQDQDYIDGYANLKGALHFDAAHTLSADVLTALEHEERQDVSASHLAAEPVPIWHNRASVGITRDVGRLYGTLSATRESWEFSDVKSLLGGTLAQSYRDTEIYSGQIKGGYRISPGYELIGRARVLRQLNDGDGKISRTGNGYEVLAGLAVESSPLLRWRILGGWGMREFDQADLANVQSLLAEGQVQWLVTQRLTFYANLARSISDQLSADGGGLVETKLDARLEYELWHNLVLTLGGAAAIDQFQGASRTDHVYSGRLGVEYWANKNWLFTFTYEHQIRESTDPAFDMTRDRVSVGAKLRF